MKIKFNVKLTASLVSFFIGILFVALSKGGHKLIFVGFLFFAVGFAIFAFFNSERAEKLIKQYDKEISANYKRLEELEEDASPEALAETEAIDANCTYLYKQRKVQSKGKGKLKVVFLVGSVFFVLLGFLILFT